MMSASEVRKILDKIAEDAGIQKIDEKEYGNECRNVYYLMSGSESYFMNFTWYDSGSWRVDVADRIKCDSHIWTTGNITVYSIGFNSFVCKMIKDQLEELITDYNKALKEMKQKEKNQKIKEILNAGAKYELV